MDWFADHHVETWLLIAAVLAVLELVSTELILIMLSGGALAGVAAAAAGLPWQAQLAIALVVATALLVGLRPPMARRLHGAPTLESGAPAVIGQAALVMEQVGPEGPGRVKIGGDVWSAQPEDGASVFAPGTRVVVAAIKGGMALVVAHSEHDPASAQDRGVR